MPNDYRIEMPPGMLMLSLNGTLGDDKKKLDWLQRAHIMTGIRKIACDAAKEISFTPLARVRLRIIHRPPNRKPHDCTTGNYFYTYKAVIDGLVEAGMFPDDNSNVVTEMSLVCGEILKQGQVIIQVMEADGGDV